MNNSDCGFLFITESCNLSCSHCYVSAEPDIGSFMDQHTVNRALDIFQSLGISDIRFTGGEPTIHPQFAEIINLALDRGFHLGLVTNGKRFLNRKWQPNLLVKFSRCWISVYGLTASSHTFTAMSKNASLENILSFVGQKTRMGHRIGISAIISPEEVCSLSRFIEDAFNAGIRRVRFIPLEPDGRARHKVRINWVNVPMEIRKAYEIIKSHPLSNQFLSLTINNPFDLEDFSGISTNSCLLKTRQMWSIVPSGDIYTCCFNVYQHKHLLGNVKESTIDTKLKMKTAQLKEGVNCRGLDKTFWREASPRNITCPISSVGLNNVICQIQGKDND